MSRDRLINLSIGAAFAALIVWIAMHTYWADVSVPTPLQGEAARNPYYSVQHLLGSLGIRTRLIGSLQALPKNAVVLVNDLHDDLFHERLESLESWVDSGGRLIATGDALWSSGELQTWSGIESSHRDPQAAARTSGDESCAPMTVRRAGAANGETLRVCASAADFSFASKRVPAWVLSDAQGIAVLRAAVGRGELTAIGPRSLLRNKTLPLQDHARVFIEASRLQRGDELLILSPSKATAAAGAAVAAGCTSARVFRRRVAAPDLARVAAIRPAGTRSIADTPLARRADPCARPLCLAHPQARLAARGGPARAWKNRRSDRSWGMPPSMSGGGPAHWPLERVSMPTRCMPS